MIHHHSADDLEALALAVDAHIHAHLHAHIHDHLHELPSLHAPGRLFAVWPAPEPGFRLQLLEIGEPRELPQQVRLPAGLLGIALHAGAWAAPLADDGRIGWRPSQHPDRERVEITALVGGWGDDVSVLRTAGAVHVLRDGVGVVLDRLRRCWARRADAAGWIAGTGGD